MKDTMPPLGWPSNLGGSTNMNKQTVSGHSTAQGRRPIARGRRRPEVVVVTGASAGVGRAIVREFARHGASLGLLARGRDGLAGAANDVERLGGRPLAVRTDVSDDRQIEQAADRIEREFGPI